MGHTQRIYSAALPLHVLAPIHPLKLLSCESENKVPEMQNISEVVLGPLTVADLSNHHLRAQVKGTLVLKALKKITCRTEHSCRFSVRYDLATSYLHSVDLQPDNVK